MKDLPKMRSDQFIRVYERLLSGKCAMFIYALSPLRLRHTSVRNMNFLGFVFFDCGSKDIISQCFDVRCADLFPGEVTKFVSRVQSESYDSFNKLCAYSQKHFYQICADFVNTKVSAYERPSAGTLFNFDENGAVS